MSRPLARLQESVGVSNLWTHVLSIAQHEPVYAYNLPARIEARFGFEPSRLLVYLVLYKLKNERYLVPAKDGQRVYYSITPSGKKLLAAAKRMLAKKARDL